MVLFVDMITPIEKAIEICNGQVGLSGKSGIPQPTISAWVNRFNFKVGAEFVITVASATDWQITPHQLRPDLYPHPNDGLPEHMRSAA